MEQDRTRLHSLDGLRGLAVLLVFLNHITPKYIGAAFPLLDRIGLFSSGVTGVTFFFLLSGFLMYYLYPNPASKFGFLQKRYTRIFPLFLTMCSGMLILALYPQLLWYQALSILVLLSLGTHVLWVYGVKKIPFSFFSKGLFFSFFTLQIVIGSFYLFWIMRQPPIVLQQLGPFVKNATVGLVNATLTFPLGNYIPMLDGVYWSLAAEILFYVIYPFFITPLILFLLPQRRIIKILFLLSLFPFLGGVDILSHHIFDLSALQFPLFYYFAFGIMLAHFYRNKPQLFHNFSQVCKGPLTYIPVVFLVIALLGEHFLNATLPSAYSSWIRLLSVLPFALVVALALVKESSLYKLLSSKILVYVGTISYSIYLSHTAIIHIYENFHAPGSLLEDVYMIIITLTITLLLSSLLYVLLEKPYFIRRKHVPLTKTKLNKTSLSFLSSKLFLSGIVLVYIFAIFLSFQSQFNLFSMVSSYNQSIFISPKATKNVISLQNNPMTTVQIPAAENNLGVIMFSITHLNPTHNSTHAPMLFFTLYETGNSKPLVRLPYVLDEFRGVDFPFGFPTIPNSKGKVYTASLSLVPPSSTNYVTIDTTSVKAIYQLNKSIIVKNPKLTMALFLNKMQNVFSNPLSLITFLLVLPLGLLSIFLIFLPSKFLLKQNT